jgi:phosphatidylserine synthase
MLRVITKIGPADILTMGNALCAIIAVTFFIRSVGTDFSQTDVNYIAIGCCLLLVSMVLDGLDGIVARKFGSKHNYGKHLDSVADMFSFAIAPGILIYCSYFTSGLDSSTSFCLIVALAVAILFGIWRLVVYIKEGHRYKNFIGLPSPSNCLFIMTMCYFYVNYRAGNLADIPVIEDIAWTITRPPQGLAIMALTSLLMMSTFMFDNGRGKGRVVTGFVVLSFFVGIILTIKEVDVKFIPQLLTWVAIWSYVALNIVIDVTDTSEHGFMKRSRERRKEKRAKKDEKRKLKEEMRALRKEKAELQEETRALRRLRDRLLGKGREGDGNGSNNNNK